MAAALWRNASPACHIPHQCGTHKVTNSSVHHNGRVQCNCALLKHSTLAVALPCQSQSHQQKSPRYTWCASTRPSTSPEAWALMIVLSNIMWRATQNGVRSGALEQESNLQPFFCSEKKSCGGRCGGMPHQKTCEQLSLLFSFFPLSNVASSAPFAHCLTPCKVRFSLFLGAQTHGHLLCTLHLRSVVSL